MLLLALTIVSTVACVISALSGLGLLPQRQARPETPEPPAAVIVVRSIEVPAVELQDDGRRQAFSRSLPRPHREEVVRPVLTVSRQVGPEFPTSLSRPGEDREGAAPELGFAG